MSILSSLKQCLFSLARLGKFESERQYDLECQGRAELSESEFFDMYYAESGFPREIPLRLRRLFAEQLGFEKVIPTDYPCQILQDIDLSVLVDEAAAEFGVSVGSTEISTIDGSFDSIVRLINKKLKESNPR